jgi:hypothetical protein
MRGRKAGFAVAIGAVLATAAADVGAAEVELSEIPAPVMETIKARFADIKVVGAANEVTPEGQTVWEITLDDKGKNIDTMVTPEGALLLIEREITRKELPKPVQASLDSKFAKSRYRLVEECIEVKDKVETLAYYEVMLVQPDKQLRAVQLGLDGKIEKVEKKGAEGAEID